MRPRMSRYFLCQIIDHCNITEACKDCMFFKENQCEMKETFQKIEECYRKLGKPRNNRLRQAYSNHTGIIKELKL